MRRRVAGDIDVVDRGPVPRGQACAVAPMIFLTHGCKNRAMRSHSVLTDPTAIMPSSSLLRQNLAAGLGRERDDQQADRECDCGEGDWRAESSHGSHGTG